MSLVSSPRVMVRPGREGAFRAFPGPPTQRLQD